MTNQGNFSVQIPEYEKLWIDNVTEIKSLVKSLNDRVNDYKNAYDQLLADVSSVDGNSSYFQIPHSHNRDTHWCSPGSVLVGLTPFSRGANGEILSIHGQCKKITNRN